MEIEAEMRRKIVVSVVAVGVFIALILGIGSAFASTGSFASTGGLMLVGAIVLFIFTMAGVGIFLSR